MAKKTKAAARVAPPTYTLTPADQRDIEATARRILRLPADWQAAVVAIREHNANAALAAYFKYAADKRRQAFNARSYAMDTAVVAAVREA